MVLSRTILLFYNGLSISLRLALAAGSPASYRSQRATTALARQLPSTFTEVRAMSISVFGGAERGAAGGCLSGAGGGRLSERARSPHPRATAAGLGDDGEQSGQRALDFGEAERGAAGGGSPGTGGGGVAGSA